MKEIFTSADIFDVIIAVCIFATGFLFGRIKTRSANARRMRRWESEK